MDKKKCRFTNGHNFFFWNFRKTTHHFSLRSQNSEYPRIFRVIGANQKVQKLLSTDLVNTNNNNHRILILLCLGLFHAEWWVSYVRVNRQIISKNVYTKNIKYKIESLNFKGRRHLPLYFIHAVQINQLMLNLSVHFSVLRVFSEVFQIFPYIKKRYLNGWDFHLLLHFNFFMRFNLICGCLAIIIIRGKLFIVGSNVILQSCLVEAQKKNPEYWSWEEVPNPCSSNL